MLTYLKNYLTLTKKQWNGLVVLIVLMTILVVARITGETFSKDTTINNKRVLAAIASFTRDYAAADNKKPFRFNPNGLSVEKWVQLGLSEAQAAAIKRYETKGGRFYSKQDVKKLYTLSPEVYERLQAYITLPESSIYKKKERLAVPLELNTADSAALTTVYGIGPSFARRIIKYRDRLGGFHSKAQLKEVYGFDDEKYAEISDQVKVTAARIHRISINNATFDDLKPMPYLTFKQMNAIIQYRLQHGDYTSAADMAQIAILDQPTINRIKPYLSF